MLFLSAILSLILDQFSGSRPNTYGGWKDGGRDQQTFTISYSVVGSEEWIPFDAVDAQAASATGMVAIRSVFSANLTQVDAVRFVGGPGIENGWAGIGEIDVIGTPSREDALLVDAGADQAVWPGIVDVLLDGTITSSELYSVQWSVIDQPEGSTVEFSPATADIEDPIVKLDMAGTYVFKLLANSGELSKIDTVTITVYQNACAYTQVQPGFEFKAGDIDYDCDVDLDDFAAMAANWLECYHQDCL